MFQFAWRPRPPSLLSDEKEEELAKNLNKYREKYEEEDDDVSVLLSKQAKEKRRRMEEWEMWLNKWKMFHEEDEDFIDVSEEVVTFEL